MTYSWHIIFNILIIKGVKYDMVESRCGILCSQCAYKEQVGCKGCINNNKPFWEDNCPVKECCKSKNNEHCGVCNDFPCEILKEFSYDEKQGDNGKRIEQCKKWCLR